MRLHMGAIPENEEFEPEVEGWLPIREPSPLLVQLIAVPIALVVLIVLGGLITLVWSEGPISLSPPLLIALLILFLPVHELLHAVVFPDGLRSPHTVIGVWPSRLVFFAHYEAAMTRNRFLAVFLAPFIGLSLLPIVLIGLLQWPSVELAVLALVNGAGASGDILGIILVLSQIPPDTMVRNQGWRSYWKKHDANG